ncbi:C-type lectin domain family 17, member A-like isoform X2 [Perca fluviatilis]|uniref:C-type lectin domain family 17, member A-like isoform X2 n=1 Tax=Perca fluviatilis TaxID=8168 RepID=UPI001965D8A6|nr:C-type lectin domain family 17, member A-like isoform X2 [Perca fluviatilis]
MNRNPQEEIEDIEEEEAANYVNVPACTVDRVAARPDQRFRYCWSSWASVYTNVLRRYSRHGSWIGLRAEGGRWKWIDGSDLTESVSYRIQEPRPAADGQCAFTNVKDRWTSESCAERKRWICEKKPLSV